MIYHVVLCSYSFTSRLAATIVKRVKTNMEHPNPTTTLTEFYNWIVERFNAVQLRSLILENLGRDVLVRLGTQSDDYTAIAQEYLALRLEYLELLPCYVVAARRECPDTLPDNDRFFALWGRFQSERRLEIPASMATSEEAASSSRLT